MFKKYKDKLKKTIEQWANNPNETQALYKVKIEAIIDDIIQRHIQKLSISSYHGFYYIENSVRDCINDIAQAKGDSLMMPRYQHLKDWSKRANWEYINLRDTLLERFKSRYSDLQKLEEERKNKEKERKNKQVSDAYSDLRKKYADLIQKFFEVTERKVSIIDDYGDENWDELPKQIEIVIKKIAKDRGGYFDAKNWKKYPFTNPDEFEQFKLLRDDLNREFKAYHERARHRDIGFNSDVISKMSGDEFETFLWRELKDLGYDVTGTPKTGDQGADLIIEKNGKKSVIQAKRHSKPVGNKAVQEIIGALNYYGADQGYVITNTSFTSSAKALAQKSNVILIDGHDLKSIKHYL